MATALPVSATMPKEMEGGSFVDELLSLGGTLAKEASLGALQIYKAKETAKIQAKLAQTQEAQAQPEVQRQNEPVKGQNGNGQTIAVSTGQQSQANNTLFAGITQKQAVIGGVALLALAGAVYALKR